MQPLISVVIPVYNREATIGRAISSVLNQTYKNLEVIVVDDASTDSTCEKVSEFRSERVRLLTLKMHCGAAKARNIGIKEAKGKFIAFQDSDDEWLNNKLEKQIEYMISEGYLISYCPYKLFERNLVKIVPDIYENNNMCEADIRNCLRTRNVIGTPTLVFDKQIISEIGLFDESLCALQDYEYVIRMAKKYDIGYVNVPLVNAYRMSSCISNNKDFIQSAQLEILRKHADFIDINSILNSYFSTSELFENGEVRWEKLDKVFDTINDCEVNIEHEEIYRLAINYIHNQYIKITNSLSSRFESFKNRLQDGRFVIYGAGYYGEKAYLYLAGEGLMPQLFLVTEQSEKSSIDGIPIISFQEWKYNNMPVLIATSWELHNEMADMLISYGIFDFCIYPYC